MWDFLDLCFVVIFLLNPVCFGFLCDASSPPLHCEVAAWLYIPFVFFQPLHSVCCWWVRARERERGKRDVWGPGAPLAKDPLSQLLAQGWFGVRDAKWRKDWRCWFSKIWDGNCETEKQALTIPPPDIFFGSDRWPGCSAIELVSFQVTVSHLCSLFSLWLCFFPVTTDDDIRVGGDPWDHPVQPPAFS